MPSPPALCSLLEKIPSSEGVVWSSVTSHCQSRVPALALFAFHQPGIYLGCNCLFKYPGYLSVHREYGPGYKNGVLNSYTQTYWFFPATKPAYFSQPVPNLHYANAHTTHLNWGEGTPLEAHTKNSEYICYMAE